jgi:hypothetical protein
MGAPLPDKNRSKKPVYQCGRRAAGSWDLFLGRNCPVGVKVTYRHWRKLQRLQQSETSVFRLFGMRFGCLCYLAKFVP